MLTELSIRNLGLIETASIELSPGLSIISGETGAGKSMLLSAIHLLTGGRAASSAVGKMSEQLSVDSCWQLANSAEESSSLRAELEELGAELDNGALMLSRTVKKDGKSRAILGGRPTTAKALSSISSQLLSIHGQSDQLKLRDSAEQLRILDSFGARNEEAHQSYRSAYRAWKLAVTTLKEVSANAAAKRRELKSIQSFIEDCESIAPQDSELDSLEATVSRLQNHEQIRERLLAAQGVLDHESYNPVALLDSVSEELRMAMSVDSELSELHALAEAACEQLSELSKALDNELDRSDGDALEELGEAQGRIVELRSLFKRSGVGSLEELEDELDQARKSLESLSVYGRPIAELQAELDTAKGKLQAEGSVLTALRLQQGMALAERVNGELSELAMGSTVFAVLIEDAEPSPSGLDAVSFTIQQRGQDPQPMGSAASGGELSRLMLALELSVADGKESRTYIFDEVDAGIGGATALEVGKRLARLAETHQVIVVSHLAQVAAYADSNLKVFKHDDGKTVSTTVSLISEEDRPREIARMLSGVESSESALEHARELLSTAASSKHKALVST